MRSDRELGLSIGNTGVENQPMLEGAAAEKALDAPRLGGAQATAYEAVRLALSKRVWPPAALVSEASLQGGFLSGPGEDWAARTAIGRFADLLRRGPTGVTAQELDTVADELEEMARQRGMDERLRDLARMARSCEALIRGQ
jgi:hypothetical protein